MLVYLPSSLRRKSQVVFIMTRPLAQKPCDDRWWVDDLLQDVVTRLHQLQGAGPWREGFTPALGTAGRGEPLKPNVG